MLYRVTTETGATIECTDNHKFPTTEGIKLLSNIRVGDELYEIGTYEVCKNKYNLTDGNFESNLPKSGQMGFQTKEFSVNRLFEETKEKR